MPYDETTRLRLKPTPKEMQLTLIILVLCWYLPNSSSYPTSNPDSQWRHSRYIIDNRRSKAFDDTTRKKFPGFRFSNETLKRKLPVFPVERYQKDLTAEASLIGTDFYQKYNEHSPPIKTLKANKGAEGRSHFQYKVNGFESEKNSSRIRYENFIQAEDIQNQNDLETREVAPSTENEKVVSRDGRVLTWVPKLDDVSVTSSTATPSTFKTPNSYLGKLEQHPNVHGFGGGATPKLTNDFGFGMSTTTSFPWRLQKTEEGNLIDKNPSFLDGHEKHVYETRIETVSYHQEVIFNQPKMEAKQSNWYQPEVRQQEVTIAHQEPEKNYEDESINVTHQENYGNSERRYEEPEKNYEEPERNYEELEKNYEEPERNYEEPERNYEMDEVVNVMTDGRVHNPQQTESKAEDNKNKFGYVVEGRNYRKYRVEERTPDGFIVGEYGVVSHDDGSLRGVRYTADGTTNPQLIYETLIKFLSL